MTKLAGLALVVGIMPWSSLASAAGTRSIVPAPRLKANELAPLCRVCDKGRACGDNCALKKMAAIGPTQFVGWQI